MKIIEAEPKIRKESLYKLKAFLSNPGLFSILLLGEKGIGKSFWLNQIQKSLREEKGGHLALDQIHHIHSKLVESNKESLQKLLDDSTNGILVFDEIEKMEYNTQVLLFDALSTTNGKIGLSKHHFIRPVFTSTWSAEKLRNSEVIFSPLWDRVSQLVVEFPPFRKTVGQVYGDFKHIWGLMDFKTYNEMPAIYEFKKWLGKSSAAFHGNFRDLEKIAILYHQYRIILYRDQGKKMYHASTEKSTFDKVVEDFEKYNHTPSRKKSLNEFHFIEGETEEKVKIRFFNQLGEWAVSMYGNKSRAAKAMSVKPDTITNWLNKGK